MHLPNRDYLLFAGSLVALAQSLASAARTALRANNVAEVQRLSQLSKQAHDARTTAAVDLGAKECGA